MADNLRTVFEVSGPFVSLYLDATASIDNAAHVHDMHWRDAARTLRQDGADAATVQAALSARGELGDGNGRVVAHPLVRRWRQAARVRRRPHATRRHCRGTRGCWCRRRG